jgi:DNA (cytosine-5)-methyltransferase 1
MRAFYNEHDRYAATWLRRLRDAGHIPPGAVDGRDIRWLEKEDLAGYEQVHLFAGIGGWPEALRLAGWPPGRPVWTGSCPCQPYSHAGDRRGDADARNLWPEFRRLVAECRPATVFGEQVTSRLGLEWVTRVRADLEALGYRVGVADLCAASVGAPHKRQRLWWVADSGGIGRGAGGGGSGGAGGAGVCGPEPRPNGEPGRLGYAGRNRRQAGRGSQPKAGRVPSHRNGVAGELGHAASVGRQEHVGGPREGGQPDVADASRARPLDHADGARPPGREEAAEEERGSTGRSGAASAWGDYDVIPCRDGFARRVERGSFPLAPRVPGRVGRLRGYGNSIIPQVGAVFIRAFLEAEEET